MLLAIDIGNTNTVLGCIDNGDILNIVNLQTGRNETWAELSIKLRQLLEIFEIDPKGFEGAIISSVVPEATENYREAVYKLCGIKCMVVGPGIKTGMNVRIDNPGTLAADIVVGSVAAMVGYGTPSIVIDMGTATTIVVIDKDKCYRGGAILPGVKLSYAALAAGTSLLPDISIGAPKKCIATNTVDSMRSGAIYGTAASIDGMIDRMEAELGYRCTIVATGGLAASVVPCCNHDIICDNDLLLKGLWILYQKNK